MRAKTSVVWGETLPEAEETLVSNYSAQHILVKHYQIITKFIAKLLLGNNQIIVTFLPDHYQIIAKLLPNFYHTIIKFY